jgi:hypothetical protein
MNRTIKNLFYFCIAITLYQSFSCRAMDNEPMKFDKDYFNNYKSINNDNDEEKLVTKVRPLISKETHSTLNRWQNRIFKAAFLTALISIEAAAIIIPLQYGMNKTQEANAYALRYICCPTIASCPCPNPLPNNYTCANLTWV